MYSMEQRPQPVEPKTTPESVGQGSQPEYAVTGDLESDATTEEKAPDATPPPKDNDTLPNDPRPQSEAPASARVDFRLHPRRRKGQDETPVDREVKALVARLVQRREQLGLSQREVAKRSGVTDHTVVSRLESLAQVPKLNTFVAWVGALGLQLTFEEDMPDDAQAPDD